uniref:B30.2/SPRY domain-containing protein n=1 Tax=Chrysemys picta bellii TaxID=8478 RepID=A0A8C3HSQ3_CHRPI
MGEALCSRSLTHRCSGKIEAERQKIVSEFEQLRQFLEEQERLLLAQLEELDKEIVKIQDENITKLSEEISHLSDLISEIEEKCQQPTSQFLQVRQLETPRSLTNFPQHRWVLAPPGSAPTPSFPRPHSNPFAKVPARTLPPPCLYWIPCPNPDLANPCSVLSTDESVIRKYQQREFLEKKNRFHPAACVLGYKGFTSGRCYWEVEVGNKDEWVLGIAKESVIHEGAISCTPEEGIWALQSTGNEYWALTSPKTALGLPRSPSNIGVYLDYEGQKVTFYDITSSGREPIFTFTSSFTGKIIPFFGRRRVQFLNIVKMLLRRQESFSHQCS